jgi:phage/plasmid-like protein (TIGR03299 family)
MGQMPASFESGFFVRKAAWHGLGTVLDDYPGSWEEARRLAGLDWEPISAPVYEFAGVSDDGQPVWDPMLAKGPRIGNFRVIEGHQRIIRSDTGALLGIPTSSYAIISHAELGTIVEAIEDVPNAKYETTVVLEGGRKIAVVVRLDEPITLPRDNSATMPYLALTTSHDGAGSCRAQSTSVRIVCANTFSAAEAQADRNGTVFSFSHTKNWREHVEGARQAIRGVQTDFKEYVDFAKGLIKLKVSEDQTAMFLEEFIPSPLVAVEASTRKLNNIEEARATIRAILNSPTCEPYKGTAMGWLAAGGEFLDHYRDRSSKGTYFTRQVEPQKRKQELSRICMQLAA